MELFDLIIIVRVREVLLREVFLKLSPSDLPLSDIIYMSKVLPPNRLSSMQVEDGNPRFHIS